METVFQFSPDVWLGSDPVSGWATRGRSPLSLDCVLWVIVLLEGEPSVSFWGLLNTRPRCQFATVANTCSTTGRNIFVPARSSWNNDRLKLSFVCVSKLTADSIVKATCTRTSYCCGADGNHGADVGDEGADGVDGRALSAIRILWGDRTSASVSPHLASSHGCMTMCAGVSHCQYWPNFRLKYLITPKKHWISLNICIYIFLCINVFFGIFPLFRFQMWGSKNRRWFTEMYDFFNVELLKWNFINWSEIQ